MTRARDLANFVSNAQGDVRFDTDTLFIDSSANSIGIGNTAPSRPLHITANPAMIMLEDSDGGSNDKKAQIQVDSGAFEVNARNDDDSSRTDNILVADLGTGNVGIGTSSPNSSLEVSKTGASAGANFEIASLTADFGSATTNDSFGGYLSFRHRTGGNILVEPARIGVVGKSNNKADLVFYGNGGTTSLNAPTELMRLSHGGGITFNGDTAGANALDDYEEGTWTPHLDNGGTILNNYSSYVKIGSFVHAYSYLSLSSIPNDNGLTQIGGLPYNSTNNANYFAGGSLSYVGSNAASHFADPLVRYGNDYIYFHVLNSNGTAVRNSTFTGANWPIILTVNYHTH